MKNLLATLQIRSRWLPMALLAAASGIPVHAAMPVGHVRSSDSFRLSGVRVPVAGMRAWPVVEGDDIVTNSAAAIISFLDGSRITLAGKSRVKLEPGDARTRVRVLDGSIQFELSKSPKIEIYNRGVRQTGSSGTVSTAAGRAPASSGSGRIRTEALPPLSRSR